MFIRLRRMWESCGYQSRRPYSSTSRWAFTKCGKPFITTSENEPIEVTHVPCMAGKIKAERYQHKRVRLVSY